MASAPVENHILGFSTPLCINFCLKAVSAQPLRENSQPSCPGNALSAIADGAAQQVGPVLRRFELPPDDGVLALFFSEAIDTVSECKI